MCPGTEFRMGETKNVSSKPGRSASACKERQARADHPDGWQKKDYSSVSEGAVPSADESTAHRSIYRWKCLCSRG